MPEAFQGPKMLRASPPLHGHVFCFPSKASLSQGQTHILLMSTEAQVPRGVHPANTISVWWEHGTQETVGSPRHGPSRLGIQPRVAGLSPSSVPAGTGLAGVCGKLTGAWGETEALERPKKAA